VSEGRARTVGLGLFLLALALYARTAAFPFVEYDDPGYVRDNPHLAHGLTAEAIGWAFTSTAYQYNWHPLTWLAHGLDVQLFALEAGRHHLVNALLHALNALLCFAALRALTRRPWPAAAVALLFAVHPLRVESVAWIAQRKDLLAGTCFFWALLEYARWVRAPARAGYARVLLAHAAGLMCKPTLVTLPFLLLVLDAWPLARAGAWRARVLEKLPLLALSAGAILLTWTAQRAGGAMDAPIALGARLVHAPIAYATYLGQHLWPVSLSVFYPHPALLAPGAPGAEGIGHGALATLLLFLLAGAAWSLRRPVPALAVGLAWFLGTLVPMIGLVQVGEQGHADRYAYLATIGLDLAAVFGVAELVRARPSLRPAATGALALVALAWTGLAWRQVGTWSSSEALFRHALAVTEANYVARNNLGLCLAQEDDLDGALAEFEAARALRPGFFHAELNVGKARYRRGEMEAARAAFERAVAARPDSAEAHLYYGITLAAGADFARADAELASALALDPATADVPTFRQARALLDARLRGD